MSCLRKVSAVKYIFVKQLAYRVICFHHVRRTYLLNNNFSNLLFLQTLLFFFWKNFACGLVYNPSYRTLSNFLKKSLIIVGKTPRLSTHLSYAKVRICKTYFFFHSHCRCSTTKEIIQSMSKIRFNRIYNHLIFFGFKNNCYFYLFHPLEIN